MSYSVSASLVAVRSPGKSSEEPTLTICSARGIACLWLARLAGMQCSRLDIYPSNRAAISICRTQRAAMVRIAQFQRWPRKARSTKAARIVRSGVVTSASAELARIPRTPLPRRFARGGGGKRTPQRVRTPSRPRRRSSRSLERKEHRRAGSDGRDRSRPRPHAAGPEMGEARGGAVPDMTRAIKEHTERGKTGTKKRRHEKVSKTQRSRGCHVLDGRNEGEKKKTDRASAQAPGRRGDDRGHLTGAGECSFASRLPRELRRPRPARRFGPAPAALHPLRRGAAARKPLGKGVH